MLDAMGDTCAAPKVRHHMEAEYWIQVQHQAMRPSVSTSNVEVLVAHKAEGLATILVQ
jgi:hypothetical protein